MCINSLWPSDAICRHWSQSTLTQVMACCLTAPSDYPNQCWLLISEVLWHSPVSNFASSIQATIPYNEFENYTFKINAASLRGQWVKELMFMIDIQYTYVGWQLWIKMFSPHPLHVTILLMTDHMQCLCLHTNAFRLFHYGATSRRIPVLVVNILWCVFIQPTPLSW